MSESIIFHFQKSNSGSSYRKENTEQKMKFSIKYFFYKYDQIHSFLRIWSHLLKKSLMENFIFRAVERYVMNEAMQ